jgi:uncharacterized protein YqjF (DUF2071 family)
MAVMLQNWHHLLFMHWALPEEALRPLLPTGLSVDLYEGRAYVGLVAFTMTGVRPPGVPRFAPLTDFHEVNVRTYVRPSSGEPGIYFFSLDAANTLAVWGARVFYALPYYSATMKMGFEGVNPPVISYSSARLWGGAPATCHLRYTPQGNIRRAEPQSLEHFLVERYTLYTARGRKLLSARVSHAPYPLQNAQVFSWQESLLAAGKIQRPPSRPLCHYSPGVSVEVSRPFVVK